HAPWRSTGRPRRRTPMRRLRRGVRGGSGVPVGQQGRWRRGRTGKSWESVPPGARAACFGSGEEVGVHGLRPLVDVKRGLFETEHGAEVLGEARRARTENADVRGADCRARALAVAETERDEKVPERRRLAFHLAPEPEVGGGKAHRGADAEAHGDRVAVDVLDEDVRPAHASGYAQAHAPSFDVGAVGPGHACRASRRRRRADDREPVDGEGSVEAEDLDGLTGAVALEGVRVDQLRRRNENESSPFALRAALEIAEPHGEEGLEGAEPEPERA